MRLNNIWSQVSMNKGVVLFVEGDTEKEFYKRILEHLHKYAPNNRFAVDKLEIKNLKGIGSYKNKAIRIFTKEILFKYPETQFTVILCYDTDVFELTAKPPVVWSDIEKVLKDNKANKVIHIKAKHSIEDWLLLDRNGLLKYLKLPLSHKIPNNRNGLKKIEGLFKMANKVYIKGSAAQGLVDSLNIKTIMGFICPELKMLCRELGIKCTSNICSPKTKK